MLTNERLEEITAALAETPERDPADVAIAELLGEVDALRKFKAWVHAFLDAKGIPANPGGPHTAEGCRIGDRMELVFAKIDALTDATSKLEPYLAHFANTAPELVQYRRSLEKVRKALALCPAAAVRA